MCCIPAVYATHEFDAGRKMMNSSVLIRRKGDEENEIWVEKIVLGFGCVLGRLENDERPFVQIMECIPPSNAVHDASRCLRLWWAAADGGKNETNVVRSEGGNSRTVAERWFGMILFESIFSTVHVV